MSTLSSSSLSLSSSPAAISNLNKGEPKLAPLSVTTHSAYNPHPVTATPAIPSLPTLPLAILQSIYHQHTTHYSSFLNKQTTGFYDLSFQHGLPLQYLAYQIHQSSLSDPDNLRSTVFPSSRYTPPSPPSLPSSNLSLPLYENDDHRITQRYRQIEMGKNSIAYQRYRSTVPRLARYDKVIPIRDKFATHSSLSFVYPSTPDPYIQSNKRGWDSKVKRWRRCLHDFNLSNDIQQFFTPLTGTPAVLSSSTGVSNSGSNNGNKRNYSTANTDLNQSTERDTKRSRHHPNDPLSSSSFSDQRATNVKNNDREKEEEEEGDTNTDMTETLPVTTLPNGQVCVNDLPDTAWDIPYGLYGSCTRTTSVESLSSYLTQHPSYNTVDNSNTLLEQYRVHMNLPNTDRDNRVKKTARNSSIADTSTIDEPVPTTTLRQPVHYYHPAWLTPGQILLSSTAAIGNQPIDELYVSSEGDKQYIRLGTFMENVGKSTRATVRPLPSKIMMENVEQGILQNIAYPSKLHGTGRYEG